MDETTNNIKDDNKEKNQDWTEIVKNWVDTKLKTIEDTINIVDNKLNMAKVMAKDVIEKEKRRNNIIL